MSSDISVRIYSSTYTASLRVRASMEGMESSDEDAAFDVATRLQEAYNTGLEISTCTKPTKRRAERVHTSQSSAAVGSVAAGR